MTLHKVKVESLDFSHDGKYLVSLGGQDDSMMVVWDLSTGRPLCGGPASGEPSLCVKFFNTCSSKIVTAGHGALRIWDVDIVNRKVTPTNIKLAGFSRIIKQIVITGDDSCLYAGTTTGDIMCVALTEPHVLKLHGPKTKLGQGVISITITQTGQLLAGTGSGDVVLLDGGTLQVMKKVVLQGSVTSVCAHADDYFCGTAKSNVYYVNAKTLKEELRQTCHFERINDVC
eukprot:289576_1